jgi:TRAP-type C4-dicarboxylate transport system permease small subunit
MSPSAASNLAAIPSSGPRLFGIPYGDFGLFASVLIAAALGFMTFFAVTFVSIFGILIYNGVTHHAVDLSASYKYIALPAGSLVLVVALSVLGSVWLRRRLTGK